MGQIVGRIRGFALALGAPGLFLVAFLDSSVLPLPGITDVLLVVMVTRTPGAMLWYVALTVAGSVAGCLVMHYLGRKGGEAFVKKRFTGDKIERAMGALQRNGVMAVLVLCLLPPPAPFKLFVLGAGVAGVRPIKFVLGVAIARGIRYTILGILAIYYGDAALELMRTHGPLVGLTLAGVIVVAAVAYVVWRRRRQSTNG